MDRLACVCVRERQTGRHADTHTPHSENEREKVRMRERERERYCLSWSFIDTCFLSSSTIPGGVIFTCVGPAPAHGKVESQKCSFHVLRPRGGMPHFLLPHSVPENLVPCKGGWEVYPSWRSCA
uniref:Uncharacterized protein n=1 Tax=Rousettus aegyptiacus TaxID=9407 RepID=A0A7J8HQT8_ROUAE|nr:hypothetical protein HJG63_010884 [Rousettus aegyptiacus]